MDKEHILVLGFGAQYDQLIARAVRRNKVFSEIKDCNFNIGEIIRRRDSGSLKGIILSGGPRSVFDKGAPYINEYLLQLEVPVLGICYGMQHINHLLGGGVLHGKSVKGESGETKVFVDHHHPLFSGLEWRIDTWMSHNDSVDEDKLAPGFEIIGESQNHVAAIANDDRKIHGLQFHPEVSHTPRGLDIIGNFAHEICGCGYDWTPANFIEESKRDIQILAGDDDVLCFVSGGVDSSVGGVLVKETKIPGKKHFVYVEALMRKGETEEVIAGFKKVGIDDLVVIKAEDRFLKVLEGLSDPEEKRVAFANLFGVIRQEFCEERGLNPNKTRLMQGTLYTDRVESGRGMTRTAKIKSHHNVGCPFIDKLEEEGRLIEPNRFIFKDEAREVGRELGLPPETCDRQPFPGPGPTIRIVNGRKLDENYYFGSDGLDTKVKTVAEKEGFESYFLPFYTVGVQGDERTYLPAVLIRGPQDWKKIRKLARMLPQKFKKDVNRVLYLLDDEKKKIGHEPIENTVTRETFELWQNLEVDGKAIFQEDGFYDLQNQLILATAGADLYNTGERLGIIRSPDTENFLTVTPVVPDGNRLSWECLDRVAKALKKNYAISATVYDVTDKPPATTCME